MKYRQLGRTSLTVSRLCLGAWQFGGDWGDFETREAQAAIRQALELGVNFFDSAQAYGFGRSERILGDDQHYPLYDGCRRGTARE
jgi:aryl-alcohol dehydrogenase-like predicted oxidoreductase